MVAKRSEEMKNSTQLTLGEIILKLETVKNKNLPIFFDKTKYVPTGLCSWRGSYCELAVQYENGGDYCYEQPKPDCIRDEAPFGRDHSYKCPCGGTPKHKTSLPEKPTVSDFLAVLKLALGKYFVGYKGGDFTMGKTTPVWVANDGNCSGFLKEKGAEYNSDQSIVDITETEKKVILNTQKTDY